MKNKKNNVNTITNAILIMAIPLVLTILLFVSTREEHGYYIQADTNHGNHYKWVNTYREKAVYIGNNTFLDVNGNEWEYDDNSLEKGKTYILYMHDNGTEENIIDDVIYGTEKRKER